MITEMVVITGRVVYTLWIHWTKEPITSQAELSTVAGLLHATPSGTQFETLTWNFPSNNSRMWLTNK